MFIVTFLLQEKKTKSDEGSIFKIVKIHSHMIDNRGCVALGVACGMMDATIVCAAAFGALDGWRRRWWLWLPIATYQLCFAAFTVLLATSTKLGTSWTVLWDAVAFHVVTIIGTTVVLFVNSRVSVKPNEVKEVQTPALPAPDKKKNGHTE